jgi:hypothetical protein
MVRES